ncbi:MAG: DUF721 domain-containing protein [Bacteroidales bacterium]|nr:DUF721 domain-containing protein [Bacteroidales bacterium]
MIKSNENSIKDVIKELLNAYKLNSKLNETKVISSWEKIVGKIISVHTEKIYLKKDILFVKFDSAALRNEMLYSKEKLIKMINKEIKKKVIKDIKFI